MGGVATFAWVRDISASEEQTVSDSGGSKASQQAGTNYTKGTASGKKRSAFLLGKERVTERREVFFFVCQHKESDVSLFCCRTSE